MEPLPELVRTEHLVLRRWTVDDAPELSAAVEASLDHLRPWMPWVADEPLGPTERRALIESWTTAWQGGGDVYLAIRCDDEVIGSTGLHRRRGPVTLEIGYWIRPDRCRRGHATETAAALTEAALGVAGIEAVEIHHDAANVASRAVPERLGYTLVSEQPVGPVLPGQAGIDCTWRIDREGWRVSPARRRGGGPRSGPAR